MYEEAIVFTQATHKLFDDRLETIYFLKRFLLHSKSLIFVQKIQFGHFRIFHQNWKMFFKKYHKIEFSFNLGSKNQIQTLILDKKWRLGIVPQASRQMSN